MTSPLHRGRAAVILVAVALSVGCANLPAALTQLVNARRLAAKLQAQFAHANEAANRAVMTESDEAAASAVEEAQAARASVAQDVAELDTLLATLRYGEDQRVLEQFRACFSEYEQIDDEVLPLAVENTNVKAQRLSFGPAQTEARAFTAALQLVLRAGTTGDPWQAEALVARAVAAVRQVQVWHAPHIAEADGTVMTRLETQMADAMREARTALRELAPLVRPGGQTPLSTATAALDRFDAFTQELIGLSRRNSDVQSLALALGRKRVLAGTCEAHLRRLEEALAVRELGPRHS